MAALGIRISMAMEILIPNAAIRNLIREDKVHQIYSAMQTGRGKSGMQTLNHALAELVQKRQVRLEEALGTSSDPEELKNILQGMAGAAPAARAVK
jgi:twitching motility protein PilT